MRSQAIWLDDQQNITENPLVLTPSWASAWRFVTEVRSPSTPGYYLPLTMISLMLDSASGGGPAHLDVYHRTNLALHVLGVTALVALLLLLFRDPIAACLTGLLFGVHPLMVEPVAWMTERKTLLAATLALLSMISFVVAAALERTESHGRRRGALLASFALYVAALASKPTVILLPFMLLLLDMWPLRRFGVPALKEKVPFLLVAIASAVVTVVSQGSTSAMTLPSEQTPGGVALAFCHNIAFYLAKLAWPIDLATYYPYPEPVSLGAPGMTAGLVGTLAVAMVAGIGLHWAPGVAAALALYVVALLPTMGIIRVSNTIASEKYAYFAAVGLAIGFAWLLGSVRQHIARSRHAIVLNALLVALLVAIAGVEARATRRYLEVWQTSESLYRHVLRYAPMAWHLQYNFGDLLAADERYEEALSHYRVAAEGAPDDVDVRQQLGNTLFALHRYDEALVHYERVQQLQPTNLNVWFNSALALRKLSRTAEATSVLRALLRLTPRDVRANMELAWILLNADKPSEALPYLRTASDADPNNLEARTELANALASLGQFRAAIPHYRAAASQAPQDPALRNNFGVALMETGQLEEAIAQFRVALSVAPTLAEPRSNLDDALKRRASR